MTPQGKVLALAAVARPNSRTIAVGIPVDLVANRPQANYRWLAMTLYKNKKDYQTKVEQRLNALIKDGWVSAAYKDLVLADAAKVNFP